MSKTKPCALGGRHKWQWHSTVNQASVSSTKASFSRRTKYKCACGETKIAALDPNTKTYEQAKAGQNE